MAGRPESRADLLAMLNSHPGWSAIKEEFSKRCKDETDRIVNGTLYDQESIAKHHISIGRVRAWRELLEFPDNVEKFGPPR
jgi:hypothetical protein|tara:strand:+ start:60 stop:302 length:243 start_codon:yes stop_codon:yes gene_type:complete